MSETKCAQQVTVESNGRSGVVIFNSGSRTFSFTNQGNTEPCIFFLMLKMHRVSLCKQNRNYPGRQRLHGSFLPK